MHHKILFALAGVFLAVALIFPPAMFAVTNDNDLDNYVKYFVNPGMVTGGNATILDQIHENNTNAYIIVLVVEVIFVSLFIVTVYSGINHYHGQYSKNPPEDTADTT
jgi:hypothetical protein